MCDDRAFDPTELDNAIADVKGDLVALDLVLEAAIPDDDASGDLGIARDPAWHRVTMSPDLLRALLRAVQHVRTSVTRIDAQFQGGGCAAMMRGMDRPAA